MLKQKLIKYFIKNNFNSVFNLLNNFFEDNNILFDGDDVMFKDEIGRTQIYGEYGCGKSTNWVLKYSNSEVISVDTSLKWVKNVSKKNKKNINRLNIHHVDLGPVTNWGYPKTSNKSDFFYHYTDWIWHQNKKPDLVLIDGRFRVCCFLTCLKFGDPGTRIIFDDYKERYHYHFVEKYLNPAKVCGRQYMFIIPSKRYKFY